MKKDKLKKLKKKVQNALPVLAVSAAWCGGVVGLFLIGKYETQRKQEIRTKLEEALEAGETVVITPDGSFWIAKPKENDEV